MVTTPPTTLERTHASCARRHGHNAHRYGAGKSCHHLVHARYYHAVLHRNGPTEGSKRQRDIKCSSTAVRLARYSGTERGECFCLQTSLTVEIVSVPSGMVLARRECPMFVVALWMLCRKTLPVADNVGV